MSLTEHHKRWLTAIVLLSLIIWIIGWADMVFLTVLLSLFSAIGMYEIYKIFGLDPSDIRCVASICLGSIMLIASSFYSIPPGGLAVIFLFGVFLLLLFTDRSSPMVNKKAPLLIMGLIYIPFMLSHALRIMELEHGRMWLFYVLILTFATDVGAFYTGRTLGGPKFFPQVSPAKTWSGAIGGLLVSCLASVFIGGMLLEDISTQRLIIFGTVIPIIAMLGDLFESMFKRSGNVKDASNILPGHGGIMDRFDSILFTIPVMYYLITRGL